MKVSSTQAHADTLIKPSTRGLRQTLCHGEVLTMLSQIGWMLVYGSIDHPSAKEQGDEVHIPLYRENIEDTSSLNPGDVVTFYLYADENGLGAEGIKKNHTTEDENIDVEACSRICSRMANVFRAFADDESDCDDDFPQKVSLDYTMQCDGHSICAETHSNADNDLSMDGEDGGHALLSKRERAPSSVGSTHDGATSGAEEISSEEGMDTEDDVASTLSFPKLLPRGWRPPPGLSLPPWKMSNWIQAE